eukprot:m51a1_g1421 hypothetical protein (183) ;mRNA; f:58050-58738
MTAAVRVQRNTVPVPHDEAVVVPQGWTALLFTAFADWWDLTQQVSDLDALAIFFVALPALGSLYQFRPNYPIECVLGPRDWYPSYSDSPLTWTPVTNGLVGKWQPLKNQHPVFATDVMVYETYSTDSVWCMSLLLKETGQWVDAFQRPKRTDTSPKEAPVFSLLLLQGFFPYHTRAVLLSLT